MRTNLKEKVALVTGASSGLGARFARVLAANGALTVLAARRLERLKDLRAEIEAAGGAAHIVALDVTEQESIEAAVAQTEREVGPIDILVNNSGVSTAQRLTEVTPVDYDFMFDTNVKGAFFVAQAVARQMIARSKQQQGLRGRIVNIASIAGLRVLPDIGVYCMTKAAVIHMTRSQAVEWGRYGINVNAICPGYIRTEMNDAVWDTERGA
ncbi:MAG: SDR family NAD(P)-dependent oxidoreductase, partial [Burkholderiaceae bacterium]